MRHKIFYIIVIIIFTVESLGVSHAIGKADEQAYALRPIATSQSQKEGTGPDRVRWQSESESPVEPDSLQDIIEATDDQLLFLKRPGIGSEDRQDLEIFLVENLIRYALWHDEWQIRKDAVIKLARIRPESLDISNRVLDVISQAMLYDSNDDVRSSAIDSIGIMGKDSKNALGRLEDMLQRHDRATEREHAGVVATVPAPKDISAVSRREDVLELSIYQKAEWAAQRIRRALYFDSKIIRTVDIASGIILSIPALITIAVLIPALKLSYRKGVFFRQERIGHKGKPFIVWKLRTMADEKERTWIGSVLHWVGFDIGKFLRLSGLDELPQILSIFKGDMSLFGPRPRIAGELDEDYIDHVLSIRKPGFFSLYQAKTGPGHGKADLIHLKAMDSYEIDNFSFKMAINILYHSIKIILKSILQEALTKSGYRQESKDGMRSGGNEGPLRFARSAYARIPDFGHISQEDQTKAFKHIVHIFKAVERNELQGYLEKHPEYKKTITNIVDSEQIIARPLSPGLFPTAIVYGNGAIDINENFVKLIAHLIHKGADKVKLTGNAKGHASNLLDSIIYSLAMHEIRGHFMLVGGHASFNTDEAYAQKQRGNAYRGANLKAMLFYWLCIAEGNEGPVLEVRLESFLKKNPQLFKNFSRLSRIPVIGSLIDNISKKRLIEQICLLDAQTRGLRPNVKNIPAVNGVRNLYGGHNIPPRKGLESLPRVFNEGYNPDNIKSREDVLDIIREIVANIKKNNVRKPVSYSEVADEYPDALNIMLMYYNTIGIRRWLDTFSAQEESAFIGDIIEAYRNAKGNMPSTRKKLVTRGKIKNREFYSVFDWALKRSHTLRSMHANFAKLKRDKFGTGEAPKSSSSGVDSESIQKGGIAGDIKRSLAESGNDTLNSIPDMNVSNEKVSRIVARDGRLYFNYHTGYPRERFNLGMANAGETVILTPHDKGWSRGFKVYYKDNLIAFYDSQSDVFSTSFTRKNDHRGRFSVYQKRYYLGPEYANKTVKLMPFAGHDMNTGFTIFYNNKAIGFCFKGHEDVFFYDEDKPQAIKIESRKLEDIAVYDDGFDRKIFVNDIFARAGLTKREEDIIRRKIMYDEPMVRLAEEYGVTRQGIGYLIEHALKKLRIAAAAFPDEEFGPVPVSTKQNNIRKIHSAVSNAA
jgi:sugar transferase EpsL